MTIKIKLSSLGDLTPEGFAVRVRSFVVAMKEYAAHVEGVKIDAANPDLKPEDRRVAFPGPAEDPMIEQAAHEGYEFEGPSLEEKKAALFTEVRRLENEALNALFPPHKARHWHFMEQDARDSHAARVAIFHEDRMGAHFEQNEVPAMTPEEASIVKAAEERRAKQVFIQRHAAKHEHYIGDLTEENVDHYVIGGAFA